MENRTERRGEGGRMEQTNYQIPSQTVAPFPPLSLLNSPHDGQVPKHSFFPGIFRLMTKAKGGGRGGERRIYYTSVFVCARIRERRSDPLAVVLGLARNSPGFALPPSLGHLFMQLSSSSPNSSSSAGTSKSARLPLRIFFFSGGGGSEYIINKPHLNN